MNTSSRRPQNLSLKPKLRLEERFGDEARFIRSWFENPLSTGAVTPSGRFLARAMARCVDPAAKGPVVELGPGTGPVTEALLHRGVEQERLVLVEFDASFCRLLARRFPKALIVKGDAYRLAETLRGHGVEPPAAVVSSLPLLTKPDAARVELLRQAFELMGPNGAFVQFTYGVKSPVPLRAKGAATDFCAQASAPIWLNLPPARVWVYRSAQNMQRLPVRPDFLDRLLSHSRRLSHEFRLELEEARAKLAGPAQLASYRKQRAFDKASGERPR